MSILHNTIRVGAEITVEAWNQKGELVLADVTESVVKYRT